MYVKALIILTSAVINKGRVLWVWDRKTSIMATQDIFYVDFMLCLQTMNDLRDNNTILLHLGTFQHTPNVVLIVVCME